MDGFIDTTPRTPLYSLHSFISFTLSPGGLSGQTMTNCSTTHSATEDCEGKFLDESRAPDSGTQGPAFATLRSSGHSFPFTPSLPSDALYTDNSHSFPLTPCTPTFSPTLEQDLEKPSPFALPFTRNISAELFYTRNGLDPLSDVHLDTPLRYKYRQSEARRVLPRLVLQPSQNHAIHFDGTEPYQSPPILTAGIVNPRLYSHHFVADHVLSHEFVRKYAPGVQIGVGAFGFVVTARDRLLRQDVAVKFIEKAKVPSWGWSNVPDLGCIPTEALLLKLLNHPGIIKFLDLFQDEIYFYLVQELHGSPWCGRQQAHRAILHQKGPSAPEVLDKVPSIPCLSKSEPMSNSQSLEFVSYPPLSCDVLCEEPGCTTSSCIPPFSSSTSSSPSSPVSPETPSSPMTPPAETRYNSQRHSYDLFECIEEHQRFSESQARFVFAQVVDVIKYLDTIGVAHRDIKDENVLIDRRFRVKLIDFGAASCVDPRLHRPRPWYCHFRGTLAYAPAEIIKQAKWHQAEPADVWALGVLLSYLLTGRSAFPTAADAAQGRIILHNCVVRAENERHPTCNQGASISAACWNLLTRCLDPDPLTRASITEVKAHPWLKGALDAA